MQLPKYMRIQGRETAFKTKKPVGIFVLTWRRVRDNIYSEEDKNTYYQIDKWFKENLPGIKLKELKHLSNEDINEFIKVSSINIVKELSELFK